MRVLSDTALIFRRNIALTMRTPVWLVFGLIQPILYLAFFGPLLRIMTDAEVPGFAGTDSWRVYVPGLLVQLGLFGSTFVGFGIIAEWRAGVIERMRVTPASRVGLLLGRVLRDVAVLVVQASVLILAGVAFGLRAPVIGVFLGLSFVALLAASLAALSYAAALWTKSEDAFAPMIHSVTLPIWLLSGIILPMEGAPDWLRTISQFNPLTHIVNAMRAVFQGEYLSMTVGLGAVVGVALAAVSVAVCTKAFVKDNA